METLNGAVYTCKRAALPNGENKINITLMILCLCRYLSGLREKYHKPGAEFELTTEQKNHLGLVEPSSWTLDKMFDIQNDIAEPLVLYW